LCLFGDGLLVAKGNGSCDPLPTPFIYCVSVLFYEPIAFSMTAKIHSYPLAFLFNAGFPPKEWMRLLLLNLLTRPSPWSSFCKKSRFTVPTLPWLFHCEVKMRSAGCKAEPCGGCGQSSSLRSVFSPPALHCRPPPTSCCSEITPSKVGTDRMKGNEKTSRQWKCKKRQCTRRRCFSATQKIRHRST